jgi:hypothetical protein
VLKKIGLKPFKQRFKPKDGIKVSLILRLTKFIDLIIPFWLAGRGNV